MSATPGQAAGVDPASTAYRVHAHAFNALTVLLALNDDLSVKERYAIARAVVDAVEPLIRADERALAAREPHAAPEPVEDENVFELAAILAGNPDATNPALARIILADPRFWRQEPHAAPGERAALEDIARAAQGSIDASIPPDCDWFVSRALEGLGWLPEGWPKAEQPAPELAAYEADIASLTGQRNRVSETADQLRAQVRNLRDALERCRDAAGRSPAAVHTIASQALASSSGGDL